MKRSLGPAGPKISPIGLGCMRLGLQSTEADFEPVRVIHAALESGVELLDTADVYGPLGCALGESERWIGRALHAAPESTRSAIVATKGGLVRQGNGFRIDGSPAYLRQACENSLRALGRERIDLYQLHAPDPKVPIEDSVGALARLRDAGKIRLIGLSNVAPPQLESASRIVEISTVQNRCGPGWTRPLHDGVVAACEERGITFLAHTPLGSPAGRGFLQENASLAAIARKHDVSPAQVVLAWLRTRSAALVPLPGASRTRTARESGRAASLRLTPGEAIQIDFSIGG